MSNPKRYKSFAFSVFEFISILIYGSIVLFVGVYFISGDTKLALTYMSIIIPSLLLLYLIFSYSEIYIDGNDLKLKTIYKSIPLSNVKTYKVWWSYVFEDFNTGGDQDIYGETKPPANKINCFIKLDSENESAYIFEEIYLSNKFPNHLPYLPNEKVDDSRMVQVWDIDNCIAKLELAKNLELII